MLFAEDNGREEWSVEIRLYGVRLCFLVSVVITRVLSVNSDAAGRCLKMRQGLSKNERYVEANQHKQNSSFL